MLEILTGNIEMMILIKLALIVPVLTALALIVKYEKKTIFHWIWNSGLMYAGMIGGFLFAFDLTIQFEIRPLFAAPLIFLIGPAAGTLLAHLLLWLLARIFRISPPEPFIETPDLGTWPNLPPGVSIQSDEDQF